MLAEFDRINSRGVLGAMERQYQRTKIQEESLYYEQQKEAGAYPVVGVNTFNLGGLALSSPSPDPGPPTRTRIARSPMSAPTRSGIERPASSPRGAAESGDRRRQRVRPAHGDGQSGLLGQMSNALYEVGGQYRRNM